MLKYIAILSMLLDHINKIVYNNEYIILTLIGRLAFPLFIYLAVKSYMYYTRSKENYIFRVFIFACISIPFYNYGFVIDLFPLNIFFTITLGLSALYMIEKKYFYFVWVPFALALYVDYSFYGVLCFFAFYSYMKFESNLTYFYLVLSLLLLNPINEVFYLFVLLPLILIDMRFKIDYKSSLNKYFFYGFYPLHVAFLGLLK